MSTQNKIKLFLFEAIEVTNVFVIEKSVADRSQCTCFEKLLFLVQKRKNEMRRPLIITYAETFVKNFHDLLHVMISIYLKYIQGVPFEKSRKEMAVALKQRIFDPMLIKPKYACDAVVILKNCKQTAEKM